AIVNAARTNRDGLDRCLIEVANLSNSRRNVTLTVEPIGVEKPLKSDLLRLPPGESERVILQLAPGTGPIRASIDDDELRLDNWVALHPEPPRRVRYALQARARRQREPLEKAILASNAATRSDNKPDLLFTDRRDRIDADPNTWVVQFLSE